MSPDVIGWIAGGVVAFLAAVWTTVTSRRANRAKAKVDEVGAYSQMVADLRAEIGRLNGELKEVRTSLQATNDANGLLRTQVQRMQQTIDRMVSILKEHHVPLPEGVD